MKSVAVNSDSKFRSVTVRHAETRENFAHQTYTSSDSEALSFARLTFSDRIYECRRTKIEVGDSGASAVEQRCSLVSEGRDSRIRSAERGREADDKDDARARSQAEFAAIGDNNPW